MTDRLLETALPDPGEGLIAISLHIVNRYELYDTVETTVENEVIPAPPAERWEKRTLPNGVVIDVDTDAYDQWQQDHILNFTGTGRSRGDSWYDVKVTACSDPTLVGATYEFGY